MATTARGASLISSAKQLIASYDAQTPYTAGQARKTVGGLLIADAFVGLENPLNSKKSRPGLLGAIFGVVFGLAFMAIPWTMMKSIRDEPGFGRGPEVMLWLFLGIGGLLVLTSVVTVLLRIGSLIFGITLWRKGSAMMRDNPASAADPGLSDRVSEAFRRSVWTPGSPAAALLTPPAGVPPVAPPVVAAGWYPTADGTSQRWYDGQRWTDQVRPADEGPIAPTTL